MAFWHPAYGPGGSAAFGFCTDRLVALFPEPPHLVFHAASAARTCGKAEGQAELVKKPGQAAAAVATEMFPCASE